MFSYPKFYAEDGNGDPLRGGKLYSYKAGTSTAKVTYSEGTLTSANDNPTILNSRGEATVYLSGTYKFILKDEDDNIIWTLDNIEGANEAYVTYYYPNADATDQGATGNSDTMKYAVDTISTDKGTIFFRHDSGSATTTYTFSTSETIPANVNLVFENGAICSIDTGKTLTIYSPDNIVASWGQQIFSGDGSVASTIQNGESSANWFGALGDGTTDSTAGIKLAVAFSNSVLFPNIGSYMVSTYFDFTASMRGMGRELTVIKAVSGTAIAAFTPTSNAFSMLLNFGTTDSPSRSRRIENLQFHTNAIVDLSCFSHLTTGTSASRQLSTIIEQVKFIASVDNGDQSSKKGYAVAFDGTGGTANGRITGARFINCFWESCPRSLLVGLQNDDVSFEGCRFQNAQATEAGTPSLWPIYILGNANVKFDGCYCGIYKLDSANWSAGRKAFFAFQGTGTTSVRNSFVEDLSLTIDGSANNSNFEYIISTGQQDQNSVTMQDITLNWSSTDLTAFASVHEVNDQATIYSKYLGLKNIYAYTALTGNVQPTLVELFISTVGQDGLPKTLISFEGVDGFDELYDWHPDSLAGYAGSVLKGIHRGTRYYHVAWSKTDVNVQEQYPVVQDRLQIESCVYDFATDGGAVSSIKLNQLPDNAAIVRAWYEVITAPTSDGAATISFGIAPADLNDILSQVAFDNAAFTVAYHAGVPDGTVANFTTKTTAIRSVVIAIGTAALTAGKIRLWYEYIVSE